MPLRRKSRMISLRLSDDEFEALHTLCALHGARNVSEFIREAIERILENPDEGRSPLKLKLSQIDDKIEALDAEVARLLKMVGAEAPVIAATDGSENNCDLPSSMSSPLDTSYPGPVE